MLQRGHTDGASGQDDVRRERDQFRRVFALKVDIVLAPADVDPHIAAFGPAQFEQGLLQRRDPGLTLRIAQGAIHEHADTAHPLGLLGAGSKRPRNCRAAEKGNELAPVHLCPPENTSRAMRKYSRLRAWQFY